MIIKVDKTKAAEVAKTKIRAWREDEFKKNDIELQNAIVDGDEAAKQQAVERRDYLRDLPATCDGKTVKQLAALLESLPE